MDFLIGTPSHYSKTKMVSKDAPTSIPAGSYFLLANDGNQIVGSLVAKKYEGSFIIRHVEVEPSYRGKGIGTKLMEHIISHLKPKKLPIQLYVDPTNTPAVNLYKKLGFKLIKKGAAFGDKYALS
jgi:ribosomal protein S18 acetylase RimI-like enzyme